MKRIPVIVTLLGALLLAACGSDQLAASPTAATPTAEPTAATTPTPGPTEEPTADAGSGSVGALADALPDQVGGLPRQIIPGMDAILGPALSGAGVEGEDVEYVVAIWGSEAEGVILTGFRMSGVDRAQLQMLARILSSADTGADVSADTVTVGGKSVLRMTGTDMPEAAYLYFADDAFFTVISESPALAEELLSQLP